MDRPKTASAFANRCRLPASGLTASAFAQHRGARFRHSRFSRDARQLKPLQYFCDRSISIARRSPKNRVISGNCSCATGVHHDDTTNTAVPTNRRPFRRDRARKLGKFCARGGFEPHRRDQSADPVASLPQGPRNYAVPLSAASAADRGQTRARFGGRKRNAGSDAVWLSRARKVRGALQKGFWRKRITDQATRAINACGIASRRSASSR
jgi:hypothetical protein